MKKTTYPIIQEILQIIKEKIPNVSNEVLTEVSTILTDSSDNREISAMFPKPRSPKEYGFFERFWAWLG